MPIYYLIIVSTTCRREKMIDPPAENENKEKELNKFTIDRH